MRNNLHCQRIEIWYKWDLYSSYLNSTIKDCRRERVFQIGWNGSAVDSTWKSQNKRMKWDFNFVHLVIESQSFYFYIKGIWYTMLNL